MSLYEIKVLLKAQLDEVEKASNALDVIKGKVSDLGKESSNTEKIISGSLYNIGTRITDLALKVPSVATQAIKAFGEEEVAIQKLSASIRENGGNVAEVLPIMQQFASDMQKIAGYADDQILAMQGVATSMGVLPTQMEEVIQSAIGLSSALGMDLQSATRASSAAIQGKTELLTRYIPTLSECTTKEEKLAKVQQLSRNGFAQAQDAMNSVEGRLKAAANAWSDLQEVIGEAFVPTVKSVAVLVQVICEVFTKYDKITKALTITLSSLAVGFAFAKVGGLLNVAKMFTGVATATKGATTAMQAFNLAIKANPLGLIATIATGAVMGIMSLADYFAELTNEELKEAEAQEAAENAKRKAMEVTKKANAIINEYNNSLKLESETAKEVAERIETLSEAIEKLENSRGEWAEDQQIQNAETLVVKKKELAELQNKYLETINATATAEYEYASNQATERKYRVEQELNAARKSGIAHIIKFKEAELSHVNELEKSVELQKKYYADHAHLVKSEEDRIRIMKEAKQYAELSIEKARETSNVEKWLNAQTEASKTKQRDLDFQILKARASGNEAQAKELEGKLRIAQLTNEIFEANRKEGMSKQELINLQESASKQAQERYDLEKSITEETQRQNLAKNAQATIEDILLKNKIEQLKDEGKITEAKELEREREIKRTLAGMGDAVSDEDKNKLADMMRQTNDYQDQQQEQRSAGRSVGGYAGDTDYTSLRSADIGRSRGGSSIGGNVISTGGRSRQTGIPATVGKKNQALYLQWKEKGGSKSGESWTEYRDKKNSANSKQQLRVNARGFLNRTEGVAKSMTNKQAQAPKKAEPPTKQMPAASSALNNKLNAMGAEPKNNTNDSIGELASTVKTMSEDIKAMKNAVNNLAEKKKG